MLSKMLKDTVAETPDKDAIVFGDSRLSYGQLDNMVTALSVRLAALGAERSTCIALVLPNCPEFVVSFFAGARLDAITLALNPLLKEEELTHLFGDSSARIVITDAKRLPVCAKAIERLDQAVDIIAIDGALPQTLDFSALLDDVDRADGKPHLFEGDALYAYSSGSTGRPKQVCRTQTNLVSEADNFTATASVTASDNILCAVPLFHAHGLGNCMLAAARSGATLVILEPVLRDGSPVEVPFVFRRDRILELMEAERVSIFPGVPYMFNALAETPEDKSVDIDSLRLCFSAGNFLPLETVEAFKARFGIFVTQLYGCTEAGSVTLNVGEDSEQHPDSVGRPIRNIEVLILGDDGKEQPPGTIGEILFRSPALTDGYRNMPELNKDAFRNGGFMTGDLGRLDEEGRLYITGRKKIFIDQGGYKVDPFEIEDVLVTHPKVTEAVVVGVKGPYEGEVIKAVIVARDKCDKREILAHCKEHLAEFKVPRIVEFREEIPKSPLGKILRKDLV